MPLLLEEEDTPFVLVTYWVCLVLNSKVIILYYKWDECQYLSLLINH